MFCSLINTNKKLKNAIIVLKYQDEEGGFQDQRFSNVHAFANFLKSHPSLAQDLDYVPKRSKSIARDGKGKRYT